MVAIPCKSKKFKPSIHLSLSSEGEIKLQITYDYNLDREDHDSRILKSNVIH